MKRPAPSLDAESPPTTKDAAMAKSNNNHDDDDAKLPSSSSAEEWEHRVGLVRKHYEAKGYRVHSGLQFGCELVLYADDPSRVHSDFCVHVLQNDGLMDWRRMQSLVRSMPDLHKTLIVANPILGGDDGTLREVQELAFATEHAPFRHRKARGEVGSQRKKKTAAT
mmetsp:Transcript_1545/g.3473  ORF Transcript_1545/g.3473 Transcript_1545/m.3473 type:complete len:166 (-) Transcript_1545:310-807(-)